ncbi:MAG: NfeD family protein [Proteobacteria bacterium]|nr:NfeD family protein [Pseudomonadota bacterium]
MCHLLLLAPVFGLVIFWLSPIWIAVPVYGVILLLSILLYIATVRMMRLPQITGVYSLLQRPGVVIDVTHRGPRVRIGGEIWQAVSTDRLQVGEQVKVVEQHGMILEIERLTSRAVRGGEIAT